MNVVNIQHAKSTLSRLVAAVENGDEKEIIIARNGKLAARLVPLPPQGNKVRIGLYEGRFRAPDNIDDCNDEVLNLFGIKE